MAQFLPQRSDCQGQKLAGQFDASLEHGQARNPVGVSLNWGG